MHSHWVMMAIKSKPCYPKVIKFGRSGKRERRPQRRKKFLKRGTRRKKSISSQTLQWQDYKRASEIVSRKREREREEKMSCENKKKRKEQTLLELETVWSAEAGQWKLKLIQSYRQERASFYHSRVDSWPLVTI